jgi:hypothetical protein
MDVTRRSTSRNDHLQVAPLGHVDRAGDVGAALVDDQADAAIGQDGGLGVAGSEVDAEDGLGAQGGHVSCIGRSCPVLRA